MQRLVENIRSREADLKQRILQEEVKYQYYENLLNKVDTAVLVTDTKGKVEWSNKAALQLLGDYHQIPEQLLEQFCQPAIQMIRLRRNGIIQELAKSSTIFTAQGKEQLLISLKNIHSVLQRNEMEAWQKLISVLTHEIMNSITPILSLSETLSERASQSEQNDTENQIMLQALQTIHRRSKGLLNFVENYRRLTSLPALTLAPVNIGELLKDLKKLFPGKEFRFELPAKEVFISADRTQIEQVLINLLKNAREATEKVSEPQIEIRTAIQADPEQVIFLISDNGEGILPEVMDKIFVPFFTTKNSGSGIGLSLCKQIINQHGGSINVSSEVGKGCLFEICFDQTLHLQQEKTIFV